MYKNCSAKIDQSFFAGNTAGDISGVINIVDKCSLKISNSTFLNNWAAFKGGVISSNGHDTVDISDSYFRNNTGFTGEGGSIFGDNNCQMTVMHSTFEENNSGYKGGAISLISSKGIIESCRFTKNRAAILAGALVLEKSNLTIVNSWFHSNEAKSEGGVLSARESALTVLGSEFTNNKAEYRSGGVMFVQHQSTLSVSSTIFANNSASYTGGVIMASGSSRIEFEHVKVISNFAKIAAGLSLQPNTKFKAVSCEFSNNDASGYTGVLFVSFNSEADLVNCTFQNNTAFAMAGVAYVIRGTLKISRTSFKSNDSPKGKSLYFFGKHDNRILTYKTSFLSNAETISSDDPSSWTKLRDTKEIWVNPQSKLESTETPLASGT